VTTTAVEIKGVRKQFGATTALERIDFDIDTGEFVSLLGASGCGKSTLLRIIAGFETPTEGTVRIHQEDVTRQPPERRPTNLVFQRGALFPHMTVRENVGYGLKVKGWDRLRIDARVEEMLALVRLDSLGGRTPSQLSGGQAQRVALARALAGEPRVLLLDEPLSALDLKLRQQMQLELRAIQKRLGATFIFVTHDQTEALVMSDRIAIMNNGRIVQHGTPRDIYRRPNSVFVSHFVGETNLLSAIVGDTRDGRTSLRTEEGAYLAATRDTPLRTGQRAALSVRPERVRLYRNGLPAPEGYGANGTVTEIIYQGNTIRVGVRLNRNTLFWAEGRDEEFDGVTVGQPVAIGWNEDAAIILEEDGE
jgi:spermidine/putrescine transport system ATP-binding protein